MAFALTGYALGVAKRSIRRGFDLDLSGAQTLRRLRELGYLIPTARFYDLRREVLSSTPLPPARWFRQTDRGLAHFRHIHTRDAFPTKYKYVVEVQLRNPATDERVSFHRGIYQDEALTIPEMNEIVSRDVLEGVSPRIGVPQGYVFETVTSLQAFRH